MAVFFLSGLGSLGAQVVWTKLFALGLGHEVPSVMAVVTAVMAGLALGSAAWRSGRLGSHPMLAASALEWFVGAGVMVSGFVIPWATTLCNGWVGLDPSAWFQGAVSFFVPVLLLLPITAAMGATLPAMEAILARLEDDDRVMGRVYAINTAGAVAGCLGTAFALMPAVGLKTSLLICGTTNVVCALSFHQLFLISRGMPAPVQESGNRSSRRARGGPFTRRRLQITLIATGLLGLGLEMVGIRALSQIFENSIYSFATAVAMYLAGTTLGAEAYHRWGRSRHPIELLTWLLSCVAITVLLAAGSLPRAKEVFLSVQAAVGGGWLGIVAAEMTVAVMIFLLPCAAMGAVYAHTVSLARDPEFGVGRGVSWNYLGGAFGGGVFGIWILPGVGFKGSFLMIAAGYLMLAPQLRSWSWAVAVGALAAVSLLPSDLRLIEVPTGARLVAERTGTMATASVIADEQNNRTLRVNNRFQMGGTAASVAERRQAHLPLLLHPHPRRALVLGSGTGITLGATTVHTGLQVDSVELLPEVIEMMAQFEPMNRAPQRNPRVTLRSADARRFIRATTNRYDVILADLFHPAQDGTGSLYTQEHFEAIRDRLQPDGLFCQWLPLHQLDEVTWRIIAATFKRVFSRSEVWLLHFNVDIPVVGLMGRMESPEESLATLVERRIQETDPVELRSAGFNNAVQVLGCWLADLDAIVSAGPGSALNTDDFPRVTFLAPCGLSRKVASSDGLLIRLLEQSREGGGMKSSAGVTQPLVDRYRKARDQYLHGLSREAAGNVNDAVELYFASAEASVYFTASYARVVGLIQVMTQVDLPKARGMYERLLKVQPDQPLGRKMLAPLFQVESP